MGLQVYISFDGNCEEAMNFYKDALKADKLDIMYWKDAPQGPNEMPPLDKVMHAALMVGDGSIMGADAPHFQKPQGFSVSHNVDDVEHAKAVFDALSEGGQVMMPFAPSFFSKGFGMVMDKFGISWMIVVDGFPE